MIAGVNKNNYWEVKRFLYNFPFPEAKKGLDDLIFKEGLEPKKGLHLVVSLKPDSVKKTKRFGLVSSAIRSIE